jgi:ABC-type lipoprotein export system ATPase subunit
MPLSAPLLQLKDVSKRYDAPSGTAPLTVLDGISMEVAEGESVAIVGPSGSGKSTLLQIMGTLDQPTSGQVLFDGKDLGQFDPADIAAVRNRLIGFVFQAHYLLPQCTVLENVLVPTLAKTKTVASDVTRLQSVGTAGTRSTASPASGDKSADAVESVPTESSERLAKRLLERVGLGARIDHLPRELSGGESQRVAVVRALINRPRLLLADEPTGSLDHRSAQSLTRLLVEINKEERVTLIVVTHSREMAQQMGRVLELEDGKWKGA